MSSDSKDFADADVLRQGDRGQTVALDAAATQALSTTSSTERSTDAFTALMTHVDSPGSTHGVCVGLLRLIHACEQVQNTPVQPGGGRDTRPYWQRLDDAQLSSDVGRLLVECRGVATAHDLVSEKLYPITHASTERTLFDAAVAALRLALDYHAGSDPGHRRAVVEEILALIPPHVDPPLVNPALASNLTATDLASMLNPLRATDAAEFTARWWAAYLYAPITRALRRASVDHTPATLLTEPTETLLDRGLVTAEQVMIFVVVAASHLRGWLAVHREVTVQSSHDGPGFGRAIEAAALHNVQKQFPSHTGTITTTEQVKLEQPNGHDPVVIWTAPPLHGSAG